MLILACDMAAPGIDKIVKTNPKTAAKNVQCIHTSEGIGTSERHCHQDWSLGICGTYQPAADEVKSFLCDMTKTCGNFTGMGHHTTCPLFYNSAFRHDFIADNHYNCRSRRIAKNLPENFKMGFMETRRK